MAVHLVDAGPPGTCHPRLLAVGAANLRLHEGGFDARDAPVGETIRVRVDLTPVAAVVSEGHRVAVVVSAGDPADLTPHPDAGAITVVSDGTALSTHVVVPLLNGTLGGERPALAYPPRPFSPQWYHEQGAST